MTIATRKSAADLLTYEEYMEEYRTEPPTLQPYEIIDGVRNFMTGPKWRHQRTVLNFVSLLRRYEEERGTGLVLPSPFDVLIRRRPLRTRQPDLLFISHERLERGGGVPETGPLEVGPELVVEVLSPSETRRSLDAKIADFRAVGVDECWIVDLNTETVEALRLSAEGIEKVAVYGKGETLRSVVLPDLSLAVSDIFAP